MTWDSPCRCWKAALVATVNACDTTPRFTFLFDLSALAEGRFAY